MKLVSWNVNGIRAVMKKDFHKSVDGIKPDILCLQETKAHPEQVDEEFSEFEHHYWNSAEKKGYSGTAVFSKVKPLSVSYDMGVEEHDKEGRVITLEFADFYLVNVYTPNAGQELKRLDYRQSWDVAFLKFISGLEEKKPVIVCGDLNVAHTDIDLKNAKANYNKTAGYTQAEIDGLERYFSAGWIDSFREFNKEAGQYSYWSYRFNSRARNTGWRIDYFLISPKIRSRLTDAFILQSVMGSDHCPVGIELKI